MWVEHFLGGNTQWMCEINVLIIMIELMVVKVVEVGVIYKLFLGGDEINVLINE